MGRGKTAAAAFAPARQQAHRSGLRRFFGGIAKPFKATGKFIARHKKAFIIGGAIAGAAFIPGVAPFLAKGAKGIGRLALRGVKQLPRQLKRGFGLPKGRGIASGRQEAIERIYGGGPEEIPGIAGPEVVGGRVELPAGPPPKYHETFANAPVEVQAFVTQNALSPIVESLAVLADTFGAKVVGPKRNRATFPGLGEFKLLWGIDQDRRPTNNARWGWDGPIERGEAKQLESIDDVEQMESGAEPELDPVDVMTLAVFGNYFDQVGQDRQNHLVDRLQNDTERVASWFDHFVATGETIVELEARTGHSVWTPQGAAALQRPTSAQLQAVAAGAFEEFPEQLSAFG